MAVPVSRGSSAMVVSLGQFLGAIAVGALLAAGSVRADDPPVIQVYKLPDCGCCKAWIKYVQANGFTVKVTDLPDVAARAAENDRLGVPEHLRSCHTAVVEGYVIEGHVAVEEIRHLLDQRPKWKGLFVKDMPRGAPGMEGGDAEAYDVVAVDEHGEETVFAHHAPPDAVAPP